MSRFKTRVLVIEREEDSRREVERTRADETGVAKMVDKARFFAVRAEGIKSPGANILKQEMLSIGGEVAVARGVVVCSIPTTDVVMAGTYKQLKRLATKLKPQPFGLKVLGKEMMEAIDALEKPLVWELPGVSFDLAKKPLVMGIVNVTPDSFSDGGDNLAFEAALASAERMVAEGADILDVGGESTRPGSLPVSAEEEIGRVVPLIRELCGRFATPVSIDTNKAVVARAAVEAGAKIINDVSGFRLDPEMAKTAAECGAAVVLMHMRGVPRDMQSDTEYADLVGEVYGLLAESVELALAAGVSPSRIAIDPGIGFGKTAAGNLVLLRRLKEFASMGYPLLVGASRKAFIGKTLSIDAPKDRLEGSLAVASLAVANGASIIRAHDVLATRRAVDMAFAVKNATEG